MDGEIASMMDEHRGQSIASIRLNDVAEHLGRDAGKVAKGTIRTEATSMNSPPSIALRIAAGRCGILAGLDCRIGAP